MRELKFRAKTLEGGLIYFDLHESHISGDPDVFYVRGTPCKVGTEQEYTGLHDKNGKEIYEGDILGDSWGDGYIAYCEKCKSFEYFCVDFGCLACDGDVHWAEVVEDDGKFEVIGNIYENPELLNAPIK